MKIFTIIKRNSTRIPDKNFQVLGNKPVWHHLVDQLSPHTVFINTDCIDLLEAGNPPKNVVFLPRDQRFIDWENDAGSVSSPVIAMTRDFVENFAEDAEEVIVLTHVTSPFLRRKTLEDAAASLGDGWKSVHSVQLVRDFAWVETPGGKPREVNFDPSYVQKTQNLPPIFLSKGAFFIFRAGDFLETGLRIIEPCNFVPLSPRECVELDYPEDIDFARMLAVQSDA
ncbi:hypothetical protein N8964_00740 [Pontimonas sp.]|nr:hypothetical protein [Pontimonas sp.]